MVKKKEIYVIKLIYNVPDVTRKPSLLQLEVNTGDFLHFKTKTDNPYVIHAYVSLLIVRLAK